MNINKSPVYLMHSSGIIAEEKGAVIDGIQTLLKIVQTSDAVKIKCFVHEHMRHRV